jgi:multisubunit Na+/H+ antiporter MnhB subunit
MSDVRIKASQSVERITHCFFCNEHASHTTPLNFRYFEKRSFLAQVLSPLIQRRHALFIVCTGCILCLCAITVVLFVLLLRWIKTYFGEEKIDYVSWLPILLVLAGPYVNRLVPKRVREVFLSFPWKLLGTGKHQLLSPVCEGHFMKTDAKRFNEHMAKGGGPPVSPLQIICVIAILLVFYMVPMFFGYNDWLERLVFVGIPCIGLAFLFFAWLVIQSLTRASRRYLTGFTNENRDEFEVLHCSEDFAKEATNLRIMYENGQPIDVVSIADEVW